MCAPSYDQAFQPDNVVPDLQAIHPLHEELRDRKQSFEDISAPEEFHALKYICGDKYNTCSDNFDASHIHPVFTNEFCQYYDSNQIATTAHFNRSLNAVSSVPAVVATSSYLKKVPVPVPVSLNSYFDDANQEV